MDADVRKKLRTRANRIAGQVAGVQRMIDENRYCVDVLHQIAAVRSALDSLGVELLTRHLESCVISHGTSSEHECKAVVPGATSGGSRLLCRSSSSRRVSIGSSGGRSMATNVHRAPVFQVRHA